MGLTPSSYDLTQKVIIIYGLAAHLYKIYQNNTTKIFITPNYVFLDEKYQPFIDVSKLNSDSQSQNADDFVLFKAKFKPFLPPEIVENGKLVSEDPENKLNNYTCSF